ncbi:hypothetical protein TDB9533_01507 [Thalassocella blandensis]|nr:hypothetical protein TDB9533_01507 [Thalassocella blandensis]
MKTPALNEVLAEYSQWGGNIRNRPELVRRLDTGLTNASYIIQADKRFFKLRINAANSENLGINRAREEKILKLIAPLKISPQHIFNDQQHRYSIFEYIEGEAWTTKELETPANREKLQYVIEQYQALPLTDSPRDYLRYLQHYEKQIPETKLHQHEWKNFNNFIDQLANATEQWPPPVLCHHDLIPSNIIQQKDRIYILDWEYAAFGWGELDYLNTGINHKVQHGLTESLNFWLSKLWFLINE